jgi:hypothetical protein
MTKPTAEYCISWLNKRIEAAQEAIASKFTPSYAHSDWKHWLEIDEAIKAQLLAGQEMARALEQIAKRPDLPNPERDADWKNCQLWSQHDAKKALTAYREATSEGKETGR